jgi:putative endonuclease
MRHTSPFMAGLLPPDAGPGAAIHAFSVMAAAPGFGIRGDPAIHAPCNIPAMKGGWVYIMTNRPNGTLYVGVTSDLARRACEHREGEIRGFTKRYGLKRLVYAERHDDIVKAIQREKNLKHWPRAWKVALILRDNPTWDDLYEGLAG